MDEFMPDPDALLSEMMENVNADLAAEAGAVSGTQISAKRTSRMTRRSCRWSPIRFSIRRWAW